MEFPMNFFAAGTAMNTYEKHVPAPYIRKSFTPGEFTKAVLRVTGLGFYELFLNGAKITKGLLAPYISNPDDLVYFDEYDVTEKLNRGRNAVGLILGNGMQNAPGGRVWDFDIARFRGVPRFALSLTLTDENGFHIDCLNTAGHVGSFAGDGLTTGSGRIGDLICRRTGRGGWVWEEYDGLSDT